MYDYEDLGERVRLLEEDLQDQVLSLEAIKVLAAPDPTKEQIQFLYDFVSRKWEEYREV